LALLSKEHAERNEQQILIQRLLDTERVFDLHIKDIEVSQALEQIISKHLSSSATHCRKPFGKYGG
jgi:hypothetical protein